MTKSSTSFFIAYLLKVVQSIKLATISFAMLLMFRASEPFLPKKLLEVKIKQLTTTILNDVRIDIIHKSTCKYEIFGL